MVYNDVEIGARGHLRIQIDLVSQNQAANESVVRVRGFIWLDSGSSSADSTGNCKSRITGTNSYGPITANFSVSGTTKEEIIDKNFTVEHNADGTKTVSYRVYFGPTITSNFGDGGSVADSYTLPSLLRTPSTPAAPVLTFTPPSTLKAAWTAPSANGAAIDSYEIRWANNSAFTGATVSAAGTALSKTVTDLAKNTTWYFSVRAHNSQGWSSWSAASSYTIPNTPSTMTAPTLTVTLPNRVSVAFTAPANGGSAITGYSIQYSPNSDFSGAYTVATTASPTDIFAPSGGNWYFRVAAKNAIGMGPYGPSSTALIVSGPEVLKAGVWKSTTCYVRHEGVWKVAIPYVRKSGVWKPIDV